MQEEMCCKCDEPTGRAGKQDDSLYLEDGSGPYCEACFEAAQQSVHSDEAKCPQCGEPLAAAALHEFCYPPASPRG